MSNPPKPETRHTDPEDVPTLDPRAPRPRVVCWHSPKLMTPTGVRTDIQRAGLQRILMAVTGTNSEAAAWQKLLAREDVVGLKFNRSGQRALDTTATLARGLVESLQSAGWPVSRIVLIEAPDKLADELGTLPLREGFDAEPADFGSGSDQLASVLRQVTAVVNVPFLKTHNIAGLTCGLKNLAYGLIRRPGHLHANRCCPFITDLYATISSRVRVALTLVDGARVVFDQGPRVLPGCVDDAGMMIGGTDPVAVDAVGLARLNEVRKRRGQAEIAPVARVVPHLFEAHRRKLGVGLVDGVDVQELPEA